ncbi:RluA family pseudouridine synthase [Thiomicrorhabdus chilensis]|uniref:RluA family pseudouridine synthase n=1 Tax=Thiomicrorhabdus chilensis TaxID=63656 RepID=UPI000407F876|nr:RluA family pseudouridine synthase [Thiomicrorhabdus chilensis]
MSQPQHFVHQVETDQETALDALSQACPLTKSELKSCFSKGAVWLTQGQRKPARLRRVKKKLSKGDSIELYYNPKVLQEVPPQPRLMLDKQQYSVWFKPRGMLSQGSKWADHSALYRWVEMNFQAENETANRQAWIVHRLDRATAGLQLLAHSKKMAQTLTQMFARHQIEKSYQAIVHGKFPVERQTYQTPIDGKPAVTRVELLQYESQRDVSQVGITIESGRKHQIRKHLSAVGFYIVGDRLYGSEAQDSRLNPGHRPDLQLTAYRLEFTCPLNQERLSIELPDNELDLLDLIEPVSHEISPPIPPTAREL